MLYIIFRQDVNDDDEKAAELFNKPILESPDNWFRNKGYFKGD